MPYLISSSLGNHQIFLGSLISSHPSWSSDVSSEDEYKLSCIHGSPLQIWIDQACGYSFQWNFLPPTHLHELHFMIDYMFIFSHDYYVFHLSLLHHIIKNMGRYLDEMVRRWLHWLYNLAFPCICICFLMHLHLLSHGS
jgi:hypothetical protein